MAQNMWFAVCFSSHVYIYIYRKTLKHIFSSSYKLVETEGKSQKELNIKLILLHLQVHQPHLTHLTNVTSPTSDPTSPPTQTLGESGGTWPKWPVLPASNKGFSAAKHKRLTYKKGRNW